MLEVIRKYAFTPFDYNGHDCCDFVGDCLEALGEQNYSKLFPRHNEESAYRYIDEAGGLDKLLAEIFEATDEPPQDGDIALVKMKLEYVAGIVYRGRILVRVLSGVMDLPTERAARVYRCRA